MSEHIELVYPKKYVEDFKKMILLCYNYGFIEYGNSNQRSRIKRILKDYVNLKSTKKERIRFINKASESMKVNPFQSLYRFCRYIPFRYPAYFLSIVAALSWKFDLREGNIQYYNDYLTGAARKLGIEDNRNYSLNCKDIKNEAEYKAAVTAIENIEFDDESKTIMREALRKHFSVKFLSDNCFRGIASKKTKTSGNHLKYLSETGVICDCKPLRKSIEDHFWSLSYPTLEEIIDRAKSVDKSFEKHLRSAIDFFSRYYVFGEIGMYMLDRMGGDYDSLFRFRHEYYMQSLCDFHTADLLEAIEENKWCLINYRHGTADFTTEILCYPLEIRVGSRNGREHLMYYEPEKHSVSSLRIEFIENVTCYSDEKVIGILLKTGKNSDEKKIREEIDNAKNCLNYLWGVATLASKERGQEGNVISPVKTKKIKLVIQYDPKTEYYIRNRLLRECRHGKVSDYPEDHLLIVEIDTLSSSELIPWIRTFYKRVVSCEGFNSEFYSLEKDLTNMSDLFNKDNNDNLVPGKPSFSPPIWRVSDEVKNSLGKGEETAAHQLVFNEIFSVYYMIISEVFVELTLLEKGFSDYDSIKNYVKARLEEKRERNSKRVGKESYNILIDNDDLSLTFIGNGFFIKMPTSGKEKAKYYPRYKRKNFLNFYRDVLPLSIMEKRWLLTIIDDPKIGLFLSRDEVDVIRKVITEEKDREGESKVKPLPMDKIVFYDRYHFTGNIADEKAAISKQKSVIDTICDARDHKKILEIDYLNNSGKLINGYFVPSVIEYSKRDNRFQGYFKRCKKEDSSLAYKMEDSPLMTFNLAQIIKMIAVESDLDFGNVEAEYDTMLETNMVYVKFEFFDTKNLADRILTELSPWKRDCTKEGNIYKVKLYYRRGEGDNRGEELDIVIRLMSYGAHLRFPDKEKVTGKKKASRENTAADRTEFVRNQILERVNKQLELLRNKGEKNDDGDMR